MVVTGEMNPSTVTGKAMEAIVMAAALDESATAALLRESYKLVTGDPYENSSWQFFRDEMDELFALICLDLAGGTLTNEIVQLWADNDNHMKAWIHVAMQQGIGSAWFYRIQAEASPIGHRFVFSAGRTYKHQLYPLFCDWITEWAMCIMIASAQMALDQQRKQAA